MISPATCVKVTCVSVFIKSSLIDSNAYPSTKNHQCAVLSQFYRVEKRLKQNPQSIVFFSLDSGINRQFYFGLKHYFSQILNNEYSLHL